MSETDELWGDEEAWWTMGPAEARRRMHPTCIMVFPECVLQGDAIIAGMEQAPRWTSVAIGDRHIASTDDVAVLAYRGRAQRADGTARDVLCSSTWLRGNEGWRLIQHQQTPADPSFDPS